MPDGPHPDSTDATPPPATSTVIEQLDSLQRASEERRAELREIAAQLPDAMSRRAILRAIARDFRHAPDKGHIAGRAIRKLGRMFVRAARTLRRVVDRP
jgi:hypothetical protein